MAEKLYGVYYVEEIAESIYKIYEQRNATLYLVTGKDKACLIDTAYGLSNLKDLCSALTPLPVTVVNTHGHIDHVLGNHWFDNAYLNQADRELYDELTTKFSDIVREPWVQDFYGDFIKNIDVDTISFPIPQDIGEGDVIDLGGKKLEVYEMPGHTPGSIILVDRDEKICFSGDAIIEGMWMFLEESTEPEICLKSLKHARDVLAEAGVDKIYSGHFNYVPITMEKLETMVEAMEKIIAGELKGEPVENMAGKGIEYAYKDWKVICKM